MSNKSHHHNLRGRTPATVYAAAVRRAARALLIAAADHAGGADPSVTREALARAIDQGWPFTYVDEMEVLAAIDAVLADLSTALAAAILQRQRPNPRG